MHRNYEAHSAFKKGCGLGHVVACCYMDMEEELKDSKFYSLNLDYQLFPEGKLVNKRIYGTTEEIGVYLDMILKNEWRFERHDSIPAPKGRMVKKDNIVQLMVSGIAFTLTPVVEVFKSSFLLTNLRWNCQDPKGCQLLAKSKSAGISKELLWDGNRYVRCAKHCFEDLAYGASDEDMDCYTKESYGFPCVFRSRWEGDATGCLYIFEEEYEDLEVAKYDMQRCDMFNTETLSRELLSWD